MSFLRGTKGAESPGADGRQLGKSHAGSAERKQGEMVQQIHCGRDRGELGGGDHTELASVAAAPTSSGTKSQNKAETGNENGSRGRGAYQQHAAPLPLPSPLPSLLRLTQLSRLFYWSCLSYLSSTRVMKCRYKRKSQPEHGLKEGIIVSVIVASFWPSVPMLLRSSRTTSAVNTYLSLRENCSYEGIFKYFYYSCNLTNGH